jgi:hypothetical protein
MKAYFHNLPMRTWLILGVAAVLIAYPIVQILVPAAVHAMVPDVVRELLKVI